MKIRGKIGIMILGLSLLACWGCYSPVRSVPVNTGMLQQPSNGGGYSKRTIVLHNLQRVMDRDLDQTRRIESFEVVTTLNSATPEVLSGLSMVAKESDTPQLLVDKIKNYLRASDQGQYAINTG